MFIKIVQIEYRNKRIPSVGMQPILFRKVKIEKRSGKK